MATSNVEPAVTATAPSDKRDFRKEVTDRIVSMLENGVAPWQKPWEPASSLAIPANPVTGRSYRGGNAIHLMAAGFERGYHDPRWMTYRQAAEQGWQVRKGEKGTQIEFWDGKPPSEKDSEPEKEVSGESRFIHRVYTVFNAGQVEGVPAYEPKRPTPFEAVQAGEKILSNSGATILHDQTNRAFYDRASDSIHRPPREAFHDAAAFYGTALHEAAHWTGTPGRLNRSTLNESYRFGDPNYAREELRAELASLFLAAERGIPHNPEQHVAYVGSWIESLKRDKNEIFRAAHDASKAADFLLAFERDNQLRAKTPKGMGSFKSQDRSPRTPSANQHHWCQPIPVAERIVERQLARRIISLCNSNQQAWRCCTRKTDSTNSLKSGRSTRSIIRTVTLPWPPSGTAPKPRTSVDEVAIHEF